MDAWLKQAELIVCVGSGGVGKTTSAATIGLRAAKLGRKAMVLTIDPAKRLANSLGLQSFGNAEQQIDLSALDATGELWAMMLDSKRTMDELIVRVSPSEEARERILSNHIYQSMADAFSGTQDYMATEKLYDLVNSGKYDLVVLDTPPVKNALDFLESPGRLMNFLDRRVLDFFLASEQANKSFAARLMAGGSSAMFALLGAVFGQDFVDDLTEFFREFGGLYDGFNERHQTVLELFRKPTTGFVTVCAPTESSLDVAVYFQEELRERDLPRIGVLVNQVHRCESNDHDASAALRELAEAHSADLPAGTLDRVLARLGAAHGRLRTLTEGEQVMTQRVLHAAEGAGFYQEVPRLEGNVHDLDALNRVGEEMFRPAQAV
jgi:anion-transporting  ArsA/GET3 family ATPase